MNEKMNPRQFQEWQAAQAIQFKKSENSKFGNVWTEVDGIKFQSKAEADYYGILKIRLKARLIKGFRRQILYRLVVNSVLITTYKADFVIDELNGLKTVVDVKSEATEGWHSFQIKKNLMKALFGIEILIAKK